MGFWRKDVIQPALDRDADQAEAEQWAILEHDPGNASAWAALGALAHCRGNLIAAIGFYRRALELRPALTAAHVGLGQVYIVQGRYDEAWRHARAAEKLGDRSLAEQLERYPNAAPAHRHRG